MTTPNEQLRLGLVIAPDLGGELADDLLVDTFHLDLRVFGDTHREAFRNRMKNRVGFAEGEVEGLALDALFVASNDHVRVHALH